jgi:hypothetical protein
MTPTKHETKTRICLEMVATIIILLTLAYCGAML